MPNADDILLPPTKEAIDKITEARLAFFESNFPGLEEKIVEFFNQSDLLCDMRVTSSSIDGPPFFVRGYVLGLSKLESANDEQWEVLAWMTRRLWREMIDDER